MPDLTPLVSAAELAIIAARDDNRYELDAGRVVRMSPVGWQHGVIVVRLLGLFDAHVRPRRLGAVVTEVGFKLRSSPDTVRAPDISFVRKERLPRETLRGFWSGAPDLVMEVLSPDETSSDVEAKVAEYLDAGVSAVVVLDPDAATATVHRRSGQRHIARQGDELDLDDVVSGFRCPLDELFN